MLNCGIDCSTKPADIRPQQAIRWLWNFGHVQGCCEEDLGKLDLGHPLIQRALASIQGLDANMDVLCSNYHERDVRPDGDWGPATAELMTLPRCGHPDVPVDPLRGAGSLESFGDMRPPAGVMESLVDIRTGGPAGPANATTGTGSWPAPGCDPQARFPERHSTVLWLNPSGSPYGMQDLEVAAELAIACMFDSGMQLRVEITTREPETWTHKLVFSRTSGSVIGWFYIYQAGSGCTRLNGVLSNRYSPSNLVLYASLIVHESHGHGIGLGHTRGGIMNPSILLVDPLTYRGDTSWRIVQRYYGGDRVPQDDVPPPDPLPPDPDDPPSPPVPPPSPPTPPPTPDLPWRTILEIILAILGGCSRTEAIHALRRPMSETRRLLVGRRLFAHLKRNHGWTRGRWQRERNRILDAVDDQRAELTDQEVMAMADEAEELPENPF